MTTKDHNQKTEQEIYEEQQLLKGFAELKSFRSDMAGIKGDMGATYKRLKDLGWKKSDIEFAFSLEEKDVGQVISDFENKLRIARLFGHQLGRQLDLLDQDRTPQEDRAYDEGLAAGRQRKSATNPYTPGSPEYQRWQKGMNEGTAIANKAMDKAMNGSSED